MRTLRFVGPGTASDRIVVETHDGAERFELTVDPTLRDAVRPDRPRLTPTAGHDALRPRDIQTRVRAGESPEAIAEHAGLSLENVLRFAAPVLGERARSASEARRGRTRRNGTDGPLVVFGEMVDRRFAAHGINPDSVSWDAHRREDGQWVVSASWVGGDAVGGGEHCANWSFTLSARSVAPLDDAALDLLSDRPIRPAPAPAPFVPHLVVADPEPESGQVDERSEPHADRASHNPDGPARERVDVSEPVESMDTDVVPALPLGLAEPAGVLIPRAARRPESDEERAERARVPSWDDILLGVRRKRD